MNALTFLPSDNGDLGIAEQRSILRYDIARRAVAEAKTFDEVRDWEDKAAAVREYSRRIGDRTMELDALEIRTVARRRRGELLLALKAEGRLVEGRKKLSTADDSLPRITLDDLDVTTDESSRDQKIALLDGNSFERLVARCRAYAEGHPEKHAFDVLKPPPEGPIDGARSIMSSRQEPDDSLDFFPTPPFATRALMERVLPHLEIQGVDNVWEPACGDGHIAEVLLEYCDNVLASDIHQYGYGQVSDFYAREERVDWIITNPPFGEHGIKFVKRACSFAKIGVAMFFRSQWAVEGIERYQEIFSINPPSLCAFFAERVPICKGEWNPDGATATAYCWLLWVDGIAPQPTFWIPPGCRERLTHPDDRARFTTKPVTKKTAALEAAE